MHRRARLLLPLEVLRGEPDPLEPLLMEIAARCPGR
jgi:hypothetical protein